MQNVPADSSALNEQHHLDFVVKWTKSKQLVLMSLAVRVPPDNLSVELLEHPMGGNSGELTVDMGVFKADTITISFIIVRLIRFGGPSEGWLAALDDFRNWLIREAA